MNARKWIVVAAVSMAATGATTPHRHKPARHTVMIESMRFTPQELTVAPGDTIVWINKDVVAHTATSTTAPFDSQMIQANGTWRYTVQKKGTYAYACTFHPTMSGHVTVR